ncbi:MAG: queuosine precursor transporter, partial [Patescibacteria group bacterium]
LVVALYIFGVMSAELMGAKTFPLTSFSWMHLNASVAIFVLPLLFTLTDVVVEVHGKKRARSMVWSGLIVVALLFLFAVLATHLSPSHRFSSTESAYDKIFGLTARISLASLTAFAISEFLDVAIFAKLRQKLHKKVLWLRNNLSNFVSMFIDSLVFIFLAFYSLNHGLGDNLSFLFGLIIPYWLIKCCLSIIETPLVYVGVRWLRGK